MRRTEGLPGVAIGLIDGPVMASHPDLAPASIRPVGGRTAACQCPAGQPCLHGTFIAGILAARRGGSAPAICPGCTLLVQPVFAECVTAAGTTSAAVAQGIHDCIDAGARILNISSALSAPRLTPQPLLARALDRAARRAVLTIAAARAGVPPPAARHRAAGARPRRQPGSLPPRCRAPRARPTG
jgi:subtilisin family serine protease